MREILTVLAILLILVFTTALAGPYFVDWSAQRTLIEARLSEALGEKVRIRGAIDLKLLPTPYLVMDQIDVADATAPIGLSADRLRFEISVAPLLRGEVEFVEARMEKARLRATLGADGAFVPPDSPPRFSTQLRFDRIALIDASITIDDPTRGRSFALDHLALEAQAGSLNGPFKGEGAASVSGQTTRFRFSTGNREDDRLRFKLIVDEGKSTPRADIDGALLFVAASKGAPNPSFSGTVGLSSRWRGPAGASLSVPWRLNGALRADVRKLRFDNLDLRVGEEARAVAISGTADLDLGASPRANLSLRAKQLDLDRALTVEGDPPPLQKAATLLDAFAADASLSIMPMPLSVDWTIDTLLLGGESLDDLSGALTFDEDRPTTLHLVANGPGRTHVSLDGDIETGRAAGFNGRVEAGTGDLDKLDEWLAPVLRPGGVARKLPVRAFDLTGDASFSRVGFSGRNMTLRVDRSTLTGTLAYTRPVGADRARLFADVTAPVLDLDSLPDVDGLGQAMSPMDLSLQFAARGIKVARFGQGALEAGRVRLKMSKAGEEVIIDDVALDGLGGSTIEGSGGWTRRGAKLSGKLDAARLDEAAALLRRLAPGSATAFLAAQAAVLSPLHLTVGAEVAFATPGGSPALTSLALDGSAGATKISAKVQPDAGDASRIGATGRLEAPDAVALMRQFGLAVVPISGAGSARVDLRAQGKPGSPLDASLSASLGMTHFGFAGSIVTDPAAPRATGALKLTSSDLSPLLQAGAFSFNEIATRLPADLAGDLDWSQSGLDMRQVTGTLAATAISGRLAYRDAGQGGKRLTGAIETDRLAFATLAAWAMGPQQGAKTGAVWSSQPFTAGLIDPPATAIALKAKTFDLMLGFGASDAAMNLEIAPGLIVLRDMQMKVGDGSAAGTLTLRRDGRTAGVDGHLSLTGFALALPSARGRFSANVDLAGTGQNALALVAGLAGSGHATITDLSIPRSDPMALNRVFAAADDDRLTVDEAEVTRNLRREFDQKPLPVGSRDFDLAVAAGVLRLTPPQGATDGASTVAAPTTAISASVDLRNMTLDERLSVSMPVLPKDWKGAPPHVDVAFRGPLANATPTIEAAGFVNALAARAIARETARIQAYEFDARERLFFNQRLLSERKREQERLKAEDDMRRAAELAQRQAEALRLDRLKKADEARRKAEDDARRAAQEEPTQIRPPASLQAPAYATPGTPTDPTAAGRY